jgi:hypothetical protein
MIIQTIIVSINRNTDGTFSARLQSMTDASVTFSISLAANQAQNAYIGRQVTVTLAYV